MRACRLALGFVVAVSTATAAQDTIPPVEQGVRIGITYAPGVRPGLLVLGGERSTALDSARAILTRDLDFSDEFEMISLPLGDSLAIAMRPSTVAGASGQPELYVNYALYAALGADFVVDAAVAPDSHVVVTLFDVGGQEVRRSLRIPPTDPLTRPFRMDVHRASDEIVRAVTGVLGVAATRVLLINAGRIYLVDFDGHGVEAVSTPGRNAMSPAWSHDARYVAYMEFNEADGPLFVLDMRTGQRRVIPVTAGSINFTPAFSPDGRTLVFAQANDQGTDLYSYNLADDCCLQRLTVGGFSDNLSPTFSPDGQRIAHVSTRPGTTQIYVMSSDGTGQELFAPYDYGVTGASNAPEWSPDGLNVAFHRYVTRVQQIFVMDVATKVVRQLTSAGRNSDPTWAPDGRHLAFVSDRTGSRQIWIIDIETGRVRQLTRLGEARLPAWSPRISDRAVN